jgi:23S rRNA (uracil1939-C5)-methyltransferase
MARKSNAVIPVEDCPIADPGIRAVLKGIRPPPGKDRFTLYARGPALLAEEGTEIAGPQSPLSRGTITLLEKQIDLSAACFFQSNAAMLEKLIPVLRSAAEQAAALAAPAGAKAVMADLYAGVGTFSLFLADLFPSGADLLEENPLALKLAKINLDREQREQRFRFFPQTDERWIKKHTLESYTFAVADPPREGLSPVLAHSLVRAGPPVLAYVSCNPSSLARDYRILKQGYTLQNLFFFDFYPQTAHIESLGIFVKNNRK